MSAAPATQSHQGLKALAEQPLLSSIWRRRTHRVSRGSSVQAGLMSYTSTRPDESLFQRIYQGEFGAQYLKDASNYSADVIACTTDICEYIYKTHGRFPAHCEAIHVPGVWLQAHHIEEEYYERFFRNGMTDAHRNHDQTWHT
jgi:hypothetical protein